jgi:hypothetical protein
MLSNHCRVSMVIQIIVFNACNHMIHLLITLVTTFIRNVEKNHV